MSARIGHTAIIRLGEKSAKVIVGIIDARCGGLITAPQLGQQRQQSQKCVMPWQICDYHHCGVRLWIVATEAKSPLRVVCCEYEGVGLHRIATKM